MTKYMSSFLYEYPYSIRLHNRLRKVPVYYPYCLVQMDRRLSHIQDVSHLWWQSCS